MTNHRTTFLIDGFNLYHSAVSASKDLGGATTKWLNIKSLCEASLPLLGKDYKLEEIYYFSALAEHRIPFDADVVVRHKKFLDCLGATGIKINLAKFKEKDVYCPVCKTYTKHHEEKETDVAISIKLLELFAEKLCDSVVIISGDTDIAPAIRAAKRLYIENDIHFMFPYRRKNKELHVLCPESFKISKESYVKHQFPNQFTLPNGTTISKPHSW
jgi:uncharacterized LabA/DUF88 family protein